MRSLEETSSLKVRDVDFDSIALMFLGLKSKVKEGYANLCRSKILFWQSL